MDDQRVWAFEESLWTGDAAHYEASIDPECLMVLPQPPFVLKSQAAIQAVIDTPRWTKVEISGGQIARPQEGLIVIAYSARATREGEPPYEAHCTSVYRRLSHEEWRVIQHQQTPPLKVGGAGDGG